ncbi:MAG: hypothetical protein ACK5QH_17350 [Rubrivivax sp.]
MKNSRTHRPYGTWMPACLLGLGLATWAPLTLASLAGGKATGTSGPSAPYNHNGELFLVVHDDGLGGATSQKVSYTLDLGITLTTFLGSYTSDAGKQQFWVVDDANWTNFLAQADNSNVRWLVTGMDNQRNSSVASVPSPANFNLFTTLRQGSEVKLFDMDTLDPTQPTGLARSEFSRQFLIQTTLSAFPSFADAVSKTGTHATPGNVNLVDYTINGSSVNLETDAGLTYFGETGTPGNNLAGFLDVSTSSDGTAELKTDNAIGQSSWFYRFMVPPGAESDDNDPIIIDEADNLSADAYWGFIYVDPTLYPDSPYAGKYLLSYTLEGSSSAAALARREFAYSIGRTETTGGWRVKRLEGFASAAAGESPSWLGSQPLGVVSSVPENGTALTLLAGLGLLGAALKRRRGRAG